MLSRELMGVLGLAILWLNALLIAAAAAKQASALLGRLRTLRRLAPGAIGIGLVRGRIVGSGALARYEVEQLGRAGAAQGGARTIHFADQRFGGVILGGTIAVDEELVQIPAGPGELWPRRAAVEDAAACAEPEQFAQVYEDARKARGHRRTVAVDLQAGQTVWVAGQVRHGDDGRELCAEGSPQGRILVSALDPRTWIAARAALAIAFVIGQVLVAAAITTAALYPPIFGPVSTVGGLLGLGFFLAVQPLGVTVRDALVPPSRASVRSRWTESPK